MNRWSNFGAMSQWKCHMCLFLKMFFSAWTCNAAEFSGKSNVNKCTFPVLPVAPEQSRASVQSHTQAQAVLCHIHPCEYGDWGSNSTVVVLPLTMTCLMACLIISVNFVLLGSKMRIIITIYPEMWAMRLNEAIFVRFSTMECAIKLTVVTDRNIWRAKSVTQRTGCVAFVTLGDHLEMLQKKK